MSTIGQRVQPAPLLVVSQRRRDKPFRSKISRLLPACDKRFGVFISNDNGRDIKVPCTSQTVSSSPTVMGFHCALIQHSTTGTLTVLCTADGDAALYRRQTCQEGYRKVLGTRCTLAHLKLARKAPSSAEPVQPINRTPPDGRPLRAYPTTGSAQARRPESLPPSWAVPGRSHLVYAIKVSRESRLALQAPARPVLGHHWRAFGPGRAQHKPNTSQAGSSPCLPNAHHVT